MSVDHPPRALSTEPAERFWSRYLRREFQYSLDLSVLALAFGVAYLLRFDFVLPAEYLQPALLQLPLVVLVQFGTIFALGTYNFVWRYVGMSEVTTFLRAAVYSSLVLLALRLGLPQSLEILWIPRSVILTDTVLAFGGLLGLRILRRAIYERHERTARESSRPGNRKRPILLAGAGRAGLLAVRELLGRGDTGIEPIGFVDDARLKQNTVIGGLKVLGTTEDIPALVRTYGIDHVVITIADASAATIRRLLGICDQAGVRARIIPGYYEVLQGRIALSRFRDVQIEDLLGREPVQLDEETIRELITGKCILLTGAGGSIGTELARQIARFNPLRLVLVERFEGSLFEIEREIRETLPQLDLQSFVADVGDERRMRSILRGTRPAAVFHAAAHKHVPLMESNAAEAVKNNVLATETLARVAGKSGVGVFVLVSSDKAVRPSSIMGATKRMAELVVQDLDRTSPDCRFLAVRFGNVLGSAGSVVPIFRRQIASGGPVTVTHPDATRYFMTIPEAAQLVLQAGAIGNGGAILILDMGEPIRILDLATDMISLSGYRPYEDIQIVFTGLRPGEKLREELELSGEEIDRTSHPKIFIGRLNGNDEAEVAGALTTLRELVAKEDEKGVRATLTELLPEAQLERSPSHPPESESTTDRTLVN
jgi:FlaA1/EpsC-like NDP-sugar epimerase